MFFLSLAFRFVLYYVLALVLMAGAAVATGYWMTGLIGGLIPTMFASLLCGVAYARRTGRRAPAEVAWGVATLFAIVSAVGGVALFVLSLSDEEMRRLIAVGRASPMGLFIFALIGLLVTIVAARIFFGLGSRTRHGPVNA
jgi:Co/Zn/Cd efflux system component